MSDARILALIGELLALPAETAWVEFKENNTESALNNAQPFDESCVFPL